MRAAGALLCAAAAVAAIAWAIVADFVAEGSARDLTSPARRRCGVRSS